MFWKANQLNTLQAGAALASHMGCVVVQLDKYHQPYPPSRNDNVM